MPSGSGVSSIQEVSSPAPLGTMPAELSRAPKRVGLSLFWRTFFLLGLLLLGSILAWLQTLRALEFEPRAIQTAQQIASLVNLSRAALVHADLLTVPRGVQTLNLQCYPNVDLVPYINEGARISSTAAGKVPPQDVTFDGQITIEVRV